MASTKRANKRRSAQGQVHARKLRIAIKNAEKRYMRAIRFILRAYRSELQEQIKATLLESAEEGLFVEDALMPGFLKRALSKLNEIADTAAAKLKALVGRAFGRMVDEVREAYDQSTTLPVIRTEQLEHSIQIAMAVRQEENVQLVEQAGRVYAEQVRAVFTKPENWGLRVEELQAELEKRADVSESRANLIARDQTLKTLGGINEARQTNLGLAKYTWSNSQDERVRGRPDGLYPKAKHNHWEREGQVFYWSSPPPGGHPGEDFQCRCIAIPVIDELADL